MKASASQPLTLSRARRYSLQPAKSLDSIESYSGLDKERETDCEERLEDATSASTFSGNWPAMILKNMYARM